MSKRLVYTVTTLKGLLKGTDTGACSKQRKMCNRSTSSEVIMSQWQDNIKVNRRGNGCEGVD
jgi:hypothetical protein